jgi:ABC-type sulfate/molybdate transport systems ATPase subunit
VEFEGVTVFLNTHNLAEAERLCQQIGIIRAGKLVGFGSPSDLRARAGKPQLVITGTNFSDKVITEIETRPGVVSVDRHNRRLSIHLEEVIDTAPIVSLLVAAGAQVEEVTKSQTSLEEVFLTLINEEQDEEEAFNDKGHYNHNLERISRVYQHASGFTGRLDGFVDHPGSLWHINSLAVWHRLAQRTNNHSDVGLVAFYPGQQCCCRFLCW